MTLIIYAWNTKGYIFILFFEIAKKKLKFVKCKSVGMLLCNKQRLGGINGRRR